MIDLQPIKDKGLKADIILSCGYGMLSTLICEGQRPVTFDGRPSLFSHVSLLADPVAGVIAESTIDFEPFEYFTDPPPPVELLPESPIWPDRATELQSRADNGAQYNYLSTLQDQKRLMLIAMPLTDEQRDIVMAEADRIIKQRRYYNISGLIGALAVYWTATRIGFNPLKIPGTLFCSDFVQQSYDPVYVDFAPGLSAGLTAPDHIYQFALRRHLPYMMLEDH